MKVHAVEFLHPCIEFHSPWPLCMHNCVNSCYAATSYVLMHVTLAFRPTLTTRQAMSRLIVCTW